MPNSFYQIYVSSLKRESILYFFLPAILFRKFVLEQEVTRKFVFGAKNDITYKLTIFYL